MANSQSTSSLLCEEKLGSSDEEIVADDNDDDDDDDGYIQTLLDKETTNGGTQMQHFLQNSWTQAARAEGIHYILRKRQVLGFGDQTAYTSVTYLDRFLSRDTIREEESWAVKLLSIACLSLAAKMEEIRVPALSEFCDEDYKFRSILMQRMELLVLNALGWKMGSLSPFNFVKFFANKFCDNILPENWFSRIGEVILSSMRDAKIMCLGPSVIAAASTLFVLDQNLTKDVLQLKIGCLALSHSLKTESIISCYKSFQEKEIERLTLSRGIGSPVLSPNRLQQYGSSSVNSAKRRRLVYESGECSNADEKKPKPKPKP